MGQGISLKVKGKTHDLNHDLTFSAHTIHCVCHSIRSMFRVLGMYNFVGTEKFLPYHTFILLTYTYSTKPVPKMHKGALNRSEIVQVAPCIMQLMYL